jgi:glutamyl/glutaminyl-tRNA synthetase
MAPTPSGFLHLGNVANLLLAAWWAQAEDGRLLLRIDDFDTSRERPDYLADIFETLDWLGIHPDAGPAGPPDHLQRWSMRLRTEALRAAAHRLHREHPDLVFACRCSRRELRHGACAAGCRTAGLPLAAGHTALRLHVPAGLTRTPAAGPQAGDPWPVPAGDHVLWRRDDLPAYHLGSVLVDDELGVTGVVRGADLLDSSALQLHLAELLPAPGFRAADLRHHALLPAAGGGKLSKSAGAQAVPIRRTGALLDRAVRAATALGRPIGIRPPG